MFGSEFLRGNNLSDGRKKCAECKKRIGCFKKYYSVIAILSKQNWKYPIDWGVPVEICKSCYQIKKLTE